MARKINFQKVGGTALGFVLAGNINAAKEKINIFFDSCSITDKGKFDYYCFLHKQLYEAESQSGKDPNIEMHDYLAGEVTARKADARLFIDKRYKECLDALEDNVNKYGTYFQV